MEATITLLHVSSTCTRRPLIAPHPSSSSLYTIYALTANEDMLIKPMKNKANYKRPKVSDTSLKSSNEHDIKTRFDSEATKKCISNSNPKPTETSLSEKCPSPRPETLFDTRICSSVASQDPQTSLFACLVWHIGRLTQSNWHNFNHCTS